MKSEARLLEVGVTCRLPLPANLGICLEGVMQQEVARA